MSHIVLVHWNAAEAQERAQVLQRAGHTVACFSQQNIADMRALRESPPDVFVIDLHRTPSHGREFAVWLRQQKATRLVPLVFVEGDPDKTQRVRELLPDAVFTAWDHIRSAVRQALQHASQTPVVPGTMEGYAGAPLPKKLGIRCTLGIKSETR